LIRSIRTIVVQHVDEFYDISDIGNKGVFMQEMTKEREEYLDSLTDEYDEEAVYAIAEILGPSEDYDGLVLSLEDYSNQYEYD